MKTVLNRLEMEEWNSFQRSCEESKEGYLDKTPQVGREFPVERLSLLILIAQVHCSADEAPLHQRRYFQPCLSTFSMCPSSQQQERVPIQIHEGRIAQMTSGDQVGAQSER